MSSFFKVKLLHSSIKEVDTSKILLCNDQRIETVMQFTSARADLAVT